MPFDLRDQLQASLGSAYTLERELGGGGMSRVFVATEVALGRQVVVKVLPSESAAHVSTERFKREILLAAKLQHPHIVPLLSAGESQGLPYFTMPFVVGESLRTRLARHGELPVSEAVRILREIASALAYAHEHGIVHRDIKPDNVLLSGGSAMVTDFGVAKALSASSNAEGGSVTSLGIALGTPAYMSPEQATADPAIDHRADIYAFGVLAYELLTGQPPFVGRTPQNLLAAQVAETPEPVGKRRPGIPPALAALVMRCLEKRPADRPQRAADIVHALDDITTPSGGTMPTSARSAYARRSGGEVVRGARTRFLVGGAIVVAVGAIVFAYFLNTRGGSATPAEVKAIAVLPFQNGGDTANAYFADGMTEELTTVLTRIPGITVAAHTSAAALTGDRLSEARDKLHVGAVLEGTVRRSGNRFRVNASLVNVSNNTQIWSEQYERETKDIFAVQDSIATAIAAALRVKLSPAVQAKVSSRGTSNLQAHELLLRGRYLEDQYSDQSIRRALVLLDSAVALDPSYADAWAATGHGWGLLTDDWIAPREGVPKMRAAVQKALRLDPTSPDAHAEYGSLLLYYDRKYDEAEREFLQALALDSANVDAAVNYSSLLNALGRGDSSIAVLRRSIRLNPLSLTLAAVNASTWFRQGRIDSAEAACAKLRELSPPSNGLNSAEGCNVGALAARNRSGDAVATLRKNRPQPTGNDRANLAVLYTRAGDTVQARRELAAAKEYARHRYVRENSIARAYLVLGELDSAMAWFERGLAADDGDLFVLATYQKIFPQLRTDPRFQSILKRAGLGAFIGR